MATTTNYGWTTPDDTALVKDGAAAIRTLGSSVDTTTKNLNPSTTLGDIEYRSSTANTNTRLGIGSSGQVLSVSGGVPAWTTPAGGGGMTLLSTTTLSGGSTTVSSIDQTYRNLEIIIFGLTNSTSSSEFYLEPKAESALCDTTGTIGGSLISSAGTNDAARISLKATVNRTDANNIWNVTFFNYASTTSYKSFIGSGSFTSTSPVAGSRGVNFGGSFKSNTAITSMVFNNTGETMTAGTVLIYGVK
jgi:hypothetical protein